MSLTEGQQRLVEMALDRIDTVRESDRAPVEYILDQLVEGGTAEFHGGERPPRQDTTFLINRLRERIPSLPKLSELDNDEDEA